MSSQLGLSKDYHPSKPVLDGFGIFCITGCGIWTVLITAGMIFLWSKRDLPFLRIRRLRLTFVATYILHLYWILILIGYSLAPVVPEQLLFWMTSVYYPIGLGLFFVSNAELLAVARLQQKFLDSNGSNDLTPRRSEESTEKPKTELRKAWGRFIKLEVALRMMLVVIVAWVFQIAMTVIMWCISRKFHSTWGIAGTEVTGNWWMRHVAQGKGWEWWPAIAWQAFWYFVVAPIILWSARNIRDTHGWRAQTSVCCLSVLLTLPLWLIAIYVPGMRPANRWWIPLAWIGLSIWFIQAFTVFIPCFQIFRHQKLQQETLNAIAVWETRTRQGANNDMLEDHDASDTSRIQNQMARTFDKMNAAEGGGIAMMHFENRSSESLYTMHALEHTLDRNPEPLRAFASLRDFSGENISFLTEVKGWKNCWLRLSDDSSVRGRTTVTRRELFKRAVAIYANYVSPLYAVFPINLSARDAIKLDEVFRRAAKTLYGDSESSSDNDVTPSSWNSHDPLDRLGTADSSTRGPDSMFSAGNASMRQDVDYLTEKVQYWGRVPDGFDRSVFDAAEKSIKYLVLTNTWPKYIKAHREGSLRSGSNNSGGKGSPRRAWSALRQKES